MKNVWTLATRELSGYFSTPVAYVFLFFYLVFMGVLPFALAGFYEREQADLVPFFQLHPWLYLFLIPAVSMRLWAEERKSGTIELLMTLPVTMGQMVVGKFLAAWLFTGIALVLTFPMYWTVNWLGKPDNGVILASYIGSFLLAGGYLAVGSLFSAMTKNQVIAFVLTFVAGLGLVFAGHPLVLDWITTRFPVAITDAVRSFSFLTQMNTISGGVIDVRALTYFGSLIVACLIGSGIVLDMKKAT
ncbi:MAG: ABC transporter permease subunit [Planctomycetota bacterium]|nr:ABC transporter permease subunit [Planctomycetota bacterium]